MHQCTTSASLLPIARAYWEAGLCPLPRVSGHVEPSYVDPHGVIQAITWGQYKVKQPDWTTVAAWFARSDLATVGMILLTGSHAHPRAAQAAFLQILDLESADIWEQFQEACTYSGHADILYRCTIERTPSGGAHVGFLCPAIGDTQKLPLARRRADNKILIELLQHQCCTVAPTQIRCKPTHPAGVPYTLVQGSWAQPLTISPEQRRQLLALAASFNEVPRQVIHPAGRGIPGTRPGEVLGERVDHTWWHDLLTRHGWKDVSRAGLARQGITYWQRPGKTGRQPSATLGACGPYFYCFTSNGAPFEPDRAYSPFGAYALLEHGGDFVQAANAVAQQLGLASRPSPASCLARGTSRRPVRLFHPLTRRSL